jgi:hypothetical protein
LLTNSEAKTFRRCAREHHLAYRLRVRPRTDAGPLRFGTLLHRGLEAWWRAAATKAPPESWLPSALTALAGEADPFERVRAEEMLRGYDIRWQAEPFEVLAVEAEFTTPLVNPDTGAESKTFQLGGKIDAVARRNSDGAVLVIEHKGSSEDIGPGSDYWRRLRIDAQVSTYLVGARSLGFDAQGCLYDVLGKPKLQPLAATPVEARKYRKADGALYAGQREHDETPEEFRARLREHIAGDPDRYYVRGLVSRHEEDAREAALDLWQTARLIAESERLGRRPRNDQACMRWGRACPFFAVCAGEADIHDVNLFRMATKSHEELEGAA